MKAEVSLSIGFAGAIHEDVIEIDDEEYNECETEQQKEDLLNEYWKGWSHNFIDGSITLIE